MHWLKWCKEADLRKQSSRPFRRQSRTSAELSRTAFAIPEDLEIQHGIPGYCTRIAATEFMHPLCLRFGRKGSLYRKLCMRILFGQCLSSLGPSTTATDVQVAGSTCLEATAMTRLARHRNYPKWSAMSSHSPLSVASLRCWPASSPGS